MEIKVLLKKGLFYGLVAFYILAGINHFRTPEFYLPLIPPYLGNEELINIISGVIEIGLGLALLIPSLRYYASIAIILMLIAFIPSHWYMIEKEGCIDPNGLCVPAWVGHLRLWVIHPLLILWAWSQRNYPN